MISVHECVCVCCVWGVCMNQIFCVSFSGPRWDFWAGRGGGQWHIWTSLQGGSGPLGFLCAIKLHLFPLKSVFISTKPQLWNFPSLVVLAFSSDGALLDLIQPGLSGSDGHCPIFPLPRTGLISARYPGVKTLTVLYHAPLVPVMGVISSAHFVFICSLQHGTGAGQEGITTH